MEYQKTEVRATMPEAPEESGLRTVENNGRPVKTRFSDPVALRNTYDKLTRDDESDAVRRGRIRKLYDGNLPFNPGDLVNCAIKHVANVNWMGLKGVIDNRSSKVSKLSIDTTNLIELRPMARELAGPEAQRDARVIAEEFSAMLRETGDVISALTMMNTESDLYGLGPVTWMSSLDYKPVALERGQVRFVNDGPVLSSRHELFMFEASVPASYLFFLLDHQDVAVQEGWDVASVKDWLIRVYRDHIESAANPSVKDGTTYIESCISMIRQNRFMEERQFDQLKVIHTYVREMSFPRQVTHIICPGTDVTDPEHSKFLFVKPNAYRTMDECFIWFPYSVNRRHAKELRGLASYLYPIELLSNKYKCRMVDLAFQNAVLMFSQTTVGSQQQITLVENGPVTVVPKELQPVQNNVKPDMNQVMAVAQYLDNIGINSVTGGDKMQLSQTGPKIQQGSDRQTKAEVEMQNKQRAAKEEELFALRVSIFDKVFRETFRRAMKLVGLIVAQDPSVSADYPEVADFIGRCAKRGVPPERILSSVGSFDVVTCRDLIIGPDGKVGVLGDVLGTFGGTLDEPGRKNAVRDLIHLRLGLQSADRYAPELTRDTSPSDQSSFAKVENNMIELHKAVTVGSDQLHWAHIPVHSELLQQIVETVAAPDDNQPEQPSFNGNPESDMPIAERTLQNVGDDPRGVLSMLEAASKHVQEHLSYGGQQKGMEAQAKQVAAMLRDLRPTVKALNLAVATQERVEQAQKEQAQRDEQARIDQLAAEKAQVAQIEADKKAETDRYAIDRQHEVNMYKAQQEAGLAASRHASETAAAEADEVRRNAESDAKIEREKKLADAKVNAARALKRMDAVQSVTGFKRVTPGDISGSQNGRPINPLAL